MGMCLRKEGKSSGGNHRPEHIKSQPSGPISKDNAKPRANAIDDDAPGVQAKNSSKVSFNSSSYLLIFVLIINFTTGGTQRLLTKETRKTVCSFQGRS